jgi:hypothetical protein
MLLGVGMLFSAVGTIAGMLVMRANYKHFRAHEAEMKTMILDAGTSAEQIVMRLRNRIKI